MLTLIAAGLLQSAATAAAPPVRPPPAPAPTAPPAAVSDRVAQLEATLRSRAYGDLVRLVNGSANAQQFLATLDWLRDRSGAEHGALLNLLYARELVRANDSQVKSTGQLLDTAALALMLAAVKIRSDGAYCADQTAVIERMDQLMALDPRLVPRLQALPEPFRRQLLDAGIAFEARAAASRPADGDAPFVCAGGLTRMMEGLAAGDFREVPTPPGGNGQTFVVGNGKAPPKTVAPEIWRERQAKLRAGLPAYLRQLLKLPPAS